MSKQLISIIFNPGKGTVGVRSVNTEAGVPLEEFPRAMLKGYTFEGWFTSEKDGEKVELADTAKLPDGAVLYARYKKKQDQKTSDGKRKKSLLRRQKIAVIVLAAVVALLIAAYFVVQYIVSIYTFIDTDGTKYYIKKNDGGVYCLYDADGNLLPTNESGYYITAADSQIELDGETGKTQEPIIVDPEDGEVVGTSSRIMLYKQLTYDSTSSMATADCSRIIQSIEVRNAFGTYGFNRSIMLYDSQDAYSVTLRDGKYILCDTELEPAEKTNGAYLTPDGISIKVDESTGHYTAESADGKIFVSYNTELDGRSILNINIRVNGKDYYILPTYATGSGTTYALATYANGKVASVASKGMLNTYFVYAIDGYNISVDSSYAGFVIATDDQSFSFGVSSGVGDFVITGSDPTPYDQTLFATLAVSCGYTLSMDKLVLEDPINYAEYGLAPEKRVDADGNEYDYEPITFTVTSISGDSYTVYVGDPIVSGAGYYVRSSIRKAVYILSESGISGTIVQPIETLVTPTIVYPMSLTTYFNVQNFEYLRDTDYEKVYSTLVNDYGVEKAEDLTDEAWDELLHKYSTLVCKFSYIPLDDRQGALNSSNAYRVENEYMKGYTANEDNISSMLQSFYSMTFAGVIKLHPEVTDERDDFETYGLSEPAYIISYKFPVETNGIESVIDNYVEISARTETGIYYAYSPVYDMIVAINESQLAFLEWSDADWYQSRIFDYNIAHVSDIIINSPTTNVHFGLDNSATSQSAYYNIGGNEYIEKLDDGTSVTYTAVKGDNGYELISSADFSIIRKLNYLIAADEAKFTKYKADGTPAIILSENISNDETGITSYYYYYIKQVAGKYTLAARAGEADGNGTLVSEPRDVTAQAAYTTDFFISEGNDVYIVGKNSPSGSKLTGGKWNAGSVYLTADDAYILVNDATGAWCKLSGLTQALYTYEKQSSVEGIKGISHSGTQYKTSKGTMLLLDKQTGEIGIMYLTDIHSDKLVVNADGKPLEYVLTHISASGREEEWDAVKNFRQYFQSLLITTTEGEVSLTADEMQAFKALPDSECQLKLTVLAEDLLGNTKNLCYRFYRMKGIYSYLTIEVLDGKDLSESSPLDGYGTFCIQSSFVDKLIADTNRVLDGQLVESTSKN